MNKSLDKVLKAVQAIEAVTSTLNDTAELYLYLAMVKETAHKKMAELDEFLVKNLKEKILYPEYEKKVEPVISRDQTEINTKKLWSFLKKKDRLNDFQKVSTVKESDLKAELKDGDILATAFKVITGKTDPSVRCANMTKDELGIDEKSRK